MNPEVYVKVAGIVNVAAVSMMTDGNTRQHVHCNGSGMLLPVRDVTHLQGLISLIQTMRKETTI